MDLSSTGVIPLGVRVEVSSKGSSLWSGAQVFSKRGHPSEVAVEVSSQEVILLKWGVGGSILEGGHLFGMGVEVSTKRVIPLR